MDVIAGALADASRIMDETIVAACASMILGDQQPEWSAWEIDQSLLDIERLRDADCCYDRPSIGIAYALWYHGMRTHDALRMLLPILERNGTQPLNIVDLGCGTGATASAAALTVEALVQTGRPVPAQLTITGVDQSPFMNDIARALCAALAARVRAPQLTVTFVARRWEELPALGGARTVITAGYLLDYSDDGHAEEIAGRLETLARRLDAEEIVTTTVARKRSMLEDVTAALQRHEWALDPKPLKRGVSGSELAKCRDLRERWYVGAKVIRDTSTYFQRRPRWEGGSPVAKALLRPAGRLGETLFDALPDELQLDDRQRAAATPRDGPTALIGPAGSGKTLVLAERIALTITHPRADPMLRILVTAFNKEVVALLRRLVSEALTRHGATLDQHDAEGCLHQVRLDGRDVTVTFYNRDKLPTRVFGVPAAGDVPRRDEWIREVESRRSRLDATEDGRIAGLTGAFFATEFERFIVAKGRQDRASYAAALRTGSGRQLRERQKEVIWDLVMEPPIESHGLQRLRALTRSSVLPPFTHIFVDECQDFGEEELRHLAVAAGAPERLCAAGDPSQSIHLGTSYKRPTFDGPDWRTRRLEGSNRLPLRICEALEPLAERLVKRQTSVNSADVDAVMLGPRKASLLGVRPIVVQAEDLSRELPSILATYGQDVEDKRLLVADAQRWINDKAMSAAPEWQVTRGSMLEFKGCEWPVVVISDAWAGGLIHDAADGDVIATLEQHVFTVLTRPTRMLIVALAGGVSVAPVAQFLGRLREDRVLPWTQAAEQRLASLSPVGQKEAAYRAGNLTARDIS